MDTNNIVSGGNISSMIEMNALNVRANLNGAILMLKYIIKMLITNIIRTIIYTLTNLFVRKIFYRMAF